MKNKLDIQWFIEQHTNWEALLQEKPYCIQISRDEMFGRKLIMFKYNQIESDFNINLVRECRGLILDENTLEPVCVPFFKFGNAGESYCPEIDWKSAWVGSKIDGALIKVVKLGNDLLISTNGTICADKAPVAEQLGCKAKSFGDLVDEALLKNSFKSRQEFAEVLDEGCTYMFELTSPWTKIVVQWHDTDLTFLGCRDNKTFQETYFTQHNLNKWFKVPEVHSLKSLDDCKVAAEKLDCNHEGFVVCDKDFNRVKVKSTLYCSLHHLKGNGVMSYERGIEIVQSNELDEVLTYFPEFKAHLEKIQDDYNALAEKLNDMTSALGNWLQANGYDKQHQLVEAGGINRKDAALFITKEFGKHSGYGFALLDNKVNGVKQWLWNMPAKNLVKVLGYKD